MPTSSLALDYDEILAQVAYLAHGVRDTSRLPQEARANLDSVLRSGSRKAYYPSSLDPGLNHAWSFLNPRFELAIEEGVSDYDLPDDWGGVIGSLNFSNLENAVGQVRKLTVELLLGKRSVPSLVSGQPQYFAESPKASAGLGSQKWEILIYPIVDASYTLTGKRRVHPNALSAAAPMPYGGVEFAETILEGCLAEAEQRLLREPGIHTTAFRERLTAAIQYDTDKHIPDTLGYNADHTHRSTWRGMRRLVNNGVTVDGVTYDD